MQDKLPLVIIAGPTAVGKTAYSLRLAEQFNGEIINGDSLQVYKHLNIGTGKVTPEEMSGIPHHLLDILEVDEDYSASHFQRDVKPLIEDIHQRGKLPILEGGTGLYIEGLLFALEFGYSVSANSKILKALKLELEEVGPKVLWEKLHALDPKAASKIPFQNSQRTIRALEVIQTTGQLFSEQVGHDLQESPYDYLLIVLDRPRELLYERINRRVELMDNAGLEEEARWLFEQAGSSNFQSIKGIGYKEWLPYFKGQITRDEVIEDIQQHSRRYAKRQLTWFRNRFKHKEWVVIEGNDTYQQLEALVKEFIKETVNDE